MNLSIPFLHRPAQELKEVEQLKPVRVRTELVPLKTLVPQISVIGLVTLLIIGSALAVIYAAYDYRRLFHQHQMLVRQSDQIRIEWGQLLLEQSAWGANNRVESLAADRLSMKLPDTEQIRLVRNE